MEMFRFEHPGAFYALLLIPAFTLLFIAMLIWRKKALKRFGDWAVIQQLLPANSVGRLVLKFVLLMLAYLFLVIGMANPQLGSK